MNKRFVNLGRVVAKTLELRYINQTIEWKYDTDTDWQTLVEFKADDILDEASTNAIQNQAVYKIIQGIAQDIEDNKVTIDLALDSESTNPVANKVINSIIKTLKAASHTHSNKSILDEITKDNVHTHSNKEFLDSLDEESLMAIPIVGTLPANAKNGDMCFFMPELTDAVLAETRTVCFDWEEYSKPTMDWVVSNSKNGTTYSPYKSQVNFFSYTEEEHLYEQARTTIVSTRSPIESMISIQEYQNGNTSVATRELFVCFNTTDGTITNAYMSNDGSVTYYNSIDEIPAYWVIPEQTEYESAWVYKDPSSHTVPMFWSREWKLYIYMAGEWINLGASELSAIETTVNNKLSEVDKAINDTTEAINSNTEAIATNTETISTLVSDSKTEGSIEYKIAQAVGAIIENPDDTMNSIQELVTWCNDHAEDAVALNNQVMANKAELETLSENQHEHSNVDILKNFTEDTNGELLYKGEIIGAGSNTGTLSVTDDGNGNITLIMG